MSLSTMGMGQLTILFPVQKLKEYKGEEKFMGDKADIKELAVAAWRLEKWLSTLDTDRKMAAKSALRNIKKYIKASGVEIRDPIGSRFDPGLAVEVVNNEAEDAEEEKLIITETLTPYVYRDGELIQHARVIVGTTMKERITNNEKKNTLVVTDNIHKETKTYINDEEKEVIIGEDEIERMMIYAKIL